VLVTAFYEWELANYLPFLKVGQMSNGSRLVRASTAFKNEPFTCS
jgi:hypothetical protein